MSKQSEQEKIANWMLEAISNSNVKSILKKAKLVTEGVRCIADGGFRSDVSEVWKKLGWTMADIPDMCPHV